MARVRVMVYAALRRRLGFSKVELRGATVGDLVRKLCALRKPDVRDVLFSGEGAISNHFVLTLNSEILDNGLVMNVKVKDGDILHIFPPVSGG